MLTKLRNPKLRWIQWLIPGLLTLTQSCSAEPNSPAVSGVRPNIILVMADDQGWGQVGYYDHPALKTPNLDAMAEAGLRFDRFYAAGPVCSPTRASVLTGRTHNRTGVPGHGFNLCLQEKTLPQALKEAGYATAHFGKWHLNGVRGPGVPVLAEDPNHPGHYGFDEWLTVTNFFDLNPLMSRKGKFEEFEGDSSEVIVAEALKYMEKQQGSDSPLFVAIWYGSPHSPMWALEDDVVDPPGGRTGNHLGEIVALDRSIGALRQGLRKLGIEKNTLVWYCSDNGGLKDDPNSVAHLRGHKGDVYEGGIRVPGIIEWPGHLDPGATDYPASTMDMFPTLVDLLNLPPNSLLEVHDGQSLRPLFQGRTPERANPIPFVFQSQAALIDGNYKLLSENTRKASSWVLFDLETDPGEKKDISALHPERFEAMKRQAEALLPSVEASAAGHDYPEGKVMQPSRRAFWYELEMYEPHFDQFFQRREYQGNENKVPEELITVK